MSWIGSLCHATERAVAGRDTSAAARGRRAGRAWSRELHCTGTHVVRAANGWWWWWFFSCVRHRLIDKNRQDSGWCACNRGGHGRLPRQPRNRGHTKAVLTRRPRWAHTTTTISLRLRPPISLLSQTTAPAPGSPFTSPLLPHYLFNRRPHSRRCVLEGSAIPRPHSTPPSPDSLPAPPSPAIAAAARAVRQPCRETQR